MSARAACFPLRSPITHAGLRGGGGGGDSSSNLTDGRRGECWRHAGRRRSRTAEELEEEEEDEEEGRGGSREGEGEELSPHPSIMGRSPNHPVMENVQDGGGEHSG